MASDTLFNYDGYRHIMVWLQTQNSMATDTLWYGYRHKNSMATAMGDRAHLPVECLHQIRILQLDGVGRI